MPGNERLHQRTDLTGIQRHLVWLLRAAIFCSLCGTPTVQAQDALSLQAHYAALRESLQHNQFQRPLHLESTDSSGKLTGDIYARVEQPFSVVAPALSGMDHWCEMLTLHMNVKSCVVASTLGRDALLVDIGRKFDQPLADAYPFAFRYAITATTPDYLAVSLRAAHGPLGTSRYRIALEATPLDTGASFVHLSYTYRYGITARIAMQGYLSTIGRNKVGFTITGTSAAGSPIHVAGTLGVIERNTMRYYLAIDAYLAALSVPAPERRERRLENWYAGVERYPVQLHELERDDYLDMKRCEFARQAQSTATHRHCRHQQAVD